MKRILLNVSVIAAMSSALLFTEARPAPADSTGAAIAGGIVGLAVGAALSKKQKHTTVIYAPGYQPPYPPGTYPNAWAQFFSPKPGVTCYPIQRACYDARGAYNPKWTAITFMQ
jgi:hypothetical protein